MEDGYNEIDLDKNGTHLLGLINNWGAARSIGSTISTLGNISIISNGLNSLPLSDEAVDNIDLGELTQGTDTFSSDINSTTISESTGYSISTLDQFAQFDGTMMKFLNPDINQNNDYDIDEGLSWSFSAMYYFSPTSNDFSLDNNAIYTPLEFLPESFSFVFNTYSGFKHPSRDVVRLIFPVKLKMELLEWRH